MKRTGFIISLLVTLMTAGCAGIPKDLQWTDTEKYSMVYGFIDAKFSWCDFVDLKEPDRRVGFRVDKGLIYHEGIVSGRSYRIVGFGGGRTVFHLPVQESGFYGGDRGTVQCVGYFGFEKKGGNNYVNRLMGNRVKMLELVLPHAKGNPWEANIRKQLEKERAIEAKEKKEGKSK